jgi:hypothetical protein
MVSLRTSLRVMPAFWFALPLVLLAGGYGTALYPSDHYGLGATAMGTGALPFVAGFVAATAAWEGARLRRSVWWSPAVRSRLEIAAWAVLPSVAIGVVALLAAVAVLLVRSGATMPDPTLIAVGAFDLVAWAVVGFAAGILLPVPVAVPVGILLPFVWLAFVPAMDPPWMRHLTGMFRDCCGNAQDLAPAAVWASVLADVGIIAAAAILVGGWTDVRRRGGSVRARALPLVASGLVLVLFLRAGVGLVSGMTYAPVVPRDPAQLTCRERPGLTLCVWPEHLAQADELATVASDVRTRWLAAGIAAPAVFTEADPSVAPAGSLAYQVSGAAPDDVILALANAMTPQQPECIDPTTGASMGTTGGIAAQWLGAWYAAAGGMSADRLAQEYGSTWGMGGGTLDPLPTVDALWKVSPEARRAWSAHAAALIATCANVEVDLTVRP